MAKELGHGGPDLVRRIYGHLGDVRHRADVVEYRIEQYRGILGDRVSRLDPFVTVPGTAGEGGVVSS